MRYTGFTIKNFKGIHSLGLDISAPPHGRIHTLVGLNESGKTTILEAINSFRYGSEGESLDPSGLTGLGEADVHQLIPVAQRANFNGQISVSAHITMDPADEEEFARYMLETHLTTVTKPLGTFYLREEQTFENSRFQKSSTTWGVDVYCRTGKQRIPKPLKAGDPRWGPAAAWFRDRLPRIWYFPNFLFEFPDRIFLTDVTENDKLHKFYRAILQDILDSLDIGASLETHIIARAQSGDDIDKRSLEGLLLQMGRSVTERVFGTWNEIFRRAAPNKEVQLTCDRDGEGRLYLQFRIKDAEGYFSVSERSLGFKWFFVYRLMTSYRGSRRNSPPNTLFLFDEPASNLHSSAQTQLLKSFESLISRCYIIYTTHSQYLINPAWLENTWVVRNLGLDYEDETADFDARKTDIRVARYRNFANEHPDLTSYFQPILEVLEYKPSLLENVPRTVMLEGKNDFYTLRYVREVVLRESRELALLPGIGSGSLERLIALYLGWGRRFLVIFDSDPEGRKQKERYSNLFGPIVSDSLYCLEDINTSWAEMKMEDLFESADKLSVQQAVYPADRTYNKTHFNRAIQESYVTNQSLNVSDVTKSRFSEVFSWIDSRLPR